MQHGAHQLRDWLKRSHLNQRQGAVRLGVHYTTLNQWLRQVRFPGREKATDIEEIAGIPVAAWALKVGKSKPRSARRTRSSQYLQGANAHVS